MSAPGILLKSPKLWKVKPAKSISWQVEEKEQKGTGARNVPKLTQSEKARLKEKGAIEEPAEPTLSTSCAYSILKETPRADRPKRAFELLAFLASRGIW